MTKWVFAVEGHRCDYEIHFGVSRKTYLTKLLPTRVFINIYRHFAL
jgi:hypothetical protein